MEKRFKWPITSYSINLMRGGFGWIRLKHGDRDAGYIYFAEGDEIRRDRFGDEASDHPYIVMFQPKQLWGTIIDILRHERPLAIEGYQADGTSSVSTFFGTSTEEPVGIDER